MTRQVSFSKMRNDMMRGFREKMHRAESTEDVKKFYANTMLIMFNRLIGRNDPVLYGAVTLNPSEDGFTIDEKVRKRERFQVFWNESDLPMIMDDFTTMALHRYAHLQKNTAKTRSKIHHANGKR